MATNIPETPPDYDRTRVIERPDGYYWQDKDSGAEFGPFQSLMEAVQDMEYSADAGSEPGSPLLDAEDEIGIADWIDPDTGEPAEECIPHIEDH